MLATKSLKKVLSLFSAFVLLASASSALACGWTDASAEEEETAKTVIDMTETETRTENGVRYIGAGAYYSAHIYDGTDFYEESGSTAADEQDADSGYVPASRTASGENYFSYRVIFPADSTQINMSFLILEAGENQSVVFSNGTSGKSYALTFASYVGSVKDVELLSNTRISPVIKDATNADGKYELEITFTGGVTMADRLEFAVKGTVLPADDSDYTYSSLYELRQDSFESTYLVKTADLSRAQYDAGYFNADGEYGAGSVSDSGNAYLMYSSYRTSTAYDTETPIGGDDVYGNNVGWFRFADGGSTAALRCDSSAVSSGSAYSYTFAPDYTDSGVLIYRFEYADLLHADGSDVNAEDYTLSKIKLRVQLWSSYRVSLYVGSTDFSTVKDESGNDLRLSLSAMDARYMGTDEWVSIYCCMDDSAGVQDGSYVDLDISRFFVGTDYSCDYIYVKITDSTDQAGNGVSVQGIYLSGIYSYTGGFEISAEDTSASLNTALQLNSAVTVEKGYSTNLQTVLDSAVYVIKDADGNELDTLNDTHQYTFTADGTYTVEVAYTDKNGNTATATYSVTVGETSSDDPVTDDPATDEPSTDDPSDTTSKKSGCGSVLFGGGCAGGLLVLGAGAAAALLALVLRKKGGVK